MRTKILIDVDHPVLRDHQVYGRCLFPGLAYIDLIYQIFREHGYSYSGLELGNLVIFHPLLVRSGGSVMLEIEWRELRRDTWRVCVEGEVYRDGKPTDERQRYVTAEVRQISLPAFTEVIDPAWIRGSAERIVAAEDLYANCRERGLTHGPFMKAAGDLYVCKDAVYLDISLSAEAAVDASPALFHPTLIDGSAVLGGQSLGMPQALERGLYVPFCFESFRSSSGIQTRCFSRISLASFQRDKELTKLSIDFFDDAGRKVAELKELAGRAIHETDLISSKQSKSKQNSNGHLSQPRWKEHESLSVSIYSGGLERLLQSLIANRLLVPQERIGRMRKFFEMGLNSASLLELVPEISAKVGGILSPTLLFEYTTIAEVAEFLEAQHGTKIVPARNGNHDVHPANSADTAVPTKIEAAPLVDGIAVIGMSGRFPQAATLEHFGENLKSGKDCITEIPSDRWDYHPYFDVDKEKPGKTNCKWGGFLDEVDQFDPLFFHISPREAEVMDPQTRLFLETSWELLESSAYTRESLQTKYQGKVGVYVGAMYQHYGSVASDEATKSLLSLSSYGSIANRVSHFLGVEGPSIAVDTMCSSAATAVHLACRDLLSGECEMAIAGGVNLSLQPNKYVGLSQMQLAGSHENSRSFADGDGYLPAECVGAVLLKPLVRAQQDGDRILAVIKSTAVSHGGGSNAFTVPDPNAQARLIEMALKKAGADAASVSCVEASANGLAAADLIEIAALKKAFGKSTDERQFCSIGSVKSNIGHAEAASGMTQLIKVILQLQYGMLFPSIITGAANPGLQLEGSPFYLQQSLEEWKRPAAVIDGMKSEIPRRALINSFGAGGTYTCLLLEEPAPQLRQSNSSATIPAKQVIVFSAKTPEQLKVVVSRMMTFVKNHEEIKLEDLAYTLQVGREAMEFRLAMVVESREELIQGMQAYIEDACLRSEIPFPMFSGEVDSGSRGLDLIEGRTGHRFLKALVAEKDYEGIAECWLKGPIPWELLHKGAQPQKIALPTYPFVRSRYWVNTAVPPVAEESCGNATRAPIRQFILSFLARELKISADQINPDKNLQVYGFDSIVGTRLLRALQMEVGAQLSRRVLLQYQTVNELSAYLENQQSCTANTSDSHSRLLESVPESSENHQTDTALQALEQFKLGLLDRNDVEKLIAARIIA
jgi:3-oxoacyl-(acyl-carrier-protein) synthase/acyl carrier protein